MPQVTNGAIGFSVVGTANYLKQGTKDNKHITGRQCGEAVVYDIVARSVRISSAKDTGLHGEIKQLLKRDLTRLTVRMF